MAKDSIATPSSQDEISNAESRNAESRNEPRDNNQTESAELAARVWDDEGGDTTIVETIRLGLEKEAKSKYIRDCDCMKETQRHGMKNAWRQKICRWMFETGKAFDLNVDTVGCAMQYLDQFLCSESVDKIMMQLLSLVCVFSASKVHDTDPITLDELDLLCDSRFTRDDIRKVEVHLLRILDWELHPPNYFTFARDFIHALPVADKDEAVHAVTELLQLVAEDCGSFRHKASSIALAAVQITIGASQPASKLSAFSSVPPGQSSSDEFLAAFALVERVYESNSPFDPAESTYPDDSSLDASCDVTSSPIAVENHPLSSIMDDIQSLKRLLNAKAIPTEDEPLALPIMHTKSIVSTKKRHRAASMTLVH